MAIINSGNTPKLVSLSAPNIAVNSYGYISSSVNLPESGFVTKGSRISGKQLQLSEIGDLLNIYVDITNKSILTFYVHYYSLISTSQKDKYISLSPGASSTISMTPGILSVYCTGSLANLEAQNNINYTFSPNSQDVYGYVYSQSFVGNQTSFAAPYCALYIKQTCSLTLS